MKFKGQKFCVAVDLEGIACTIGQYGQGLSSAADFNDACLRGTNEAIAASTALYDEGAAEVLIWDTHHSGYNLKYEMFDKRCKFAIGAGSRIRFPGVDNTYSGVLFIGYHSFDAAKGVLSHVYSSATFQEYRINGESLGETQIDAAIAGKRGVRVLFAAGDNIYLEQVKNSIGNIAVVETKTALAWNNCISKHPTAVCEEIYQTVKNMDTTGVLYTINEPFDISVKYKRLEYAQSSTYRNPDNTMFERSDPYTRTGRLSTLEAIFEF